MILKLFNMNGYHKMEYTNLWLLKASFLLECFLHNILITEAGLPGDVTAQTMKTGKNDNQTKQTMELL